MEEISTYNFSTALSWMKQGRYVKRLSWSKFASLCLYEDNTFQRTEDGVTPAEWLITNEDILADDWVDAIEKEEPVVEETPEEVKKEEGGPIAPDSVI